ncbi:hypothetical protein MCEGE10_02061 [Flavobacteriaceae bacterium]
MKKLIAICLLIATGFTVKAQIIKDNKGRALATNEVTLTVTANPEKKELGWQTGFNVDFNITIGQDIFQKTFYYIQVNAIKPITSKGYFYSPSGRQSKYFPCSQLGNSCNNLQLSSANILAVWSYQGKEYKTGSLQLNTQNQNFINYYTSITKPGGVEMPIDAIKSGAAKVVRIEFVSWDFKNEYEITEILRKKFK